ncbi:MAG: M81 family metallopeptidase, partial [Clostridiales bacterium]|nr:M81 family metallopeptidase [Clostridiales bacterium]
MRIIVGSLQQETNTFSPIHSVYEDFDVVYGDRMLEKIAATEVFHKAGVELIPTLYANAVPSGKLDERSFNMFKNELVDAIPANKKPDGIWLYLHGAMEVENIGSGEVALLSAIREKVGFDLPIALALDFHANNSEELAELANIICGYRTAPHTDMKESQVRAAELLLLCIKENLLPKPVVLKIP